MLTTHRGSLTLAFPLVLTAALPAEAEACPGYYDPCEGVEAWLDLAPRNAEKIPVDGVLVLQGTYAGADLDMSMDTIVLEVTLDGQPIAGALETTPHRGTLVWRPADGWTAGATYQLTGTVTNGEAALECAAEQLLLAADLVIDTVPAAPLGVPEFTGETMLGIGPILSYQSLACCEGAPPPTDGYGGCGAYYIDFDPEQCTPTQGTGYFSLVVTGQPAADGPAAEQIVYTLKLGGTPQTTSLEPGANFNYLAGPLCVAFDATDLATGAVTSSEEQCFGEDFADQLGPQSIDPPASFTCPLEQCGASGTWDPAMCTPLLPTPNDSDTPTTSDTTPDSESAEASSDTDPDEDGKDSACACTSDPAPPPLLLALGLLALPRRRRPR